MKKHKYLTYENGMFVEKEKRFKDTNNRDEKVVELIRCKYSLDEELAIQRQRETKPQEFQEYFDFCELCKQKASEFINKHSGGEIK